MLKYLLKFVSEKEYAEQLVSGKLFMRPALYYHRLENGQGDIREAAVDSHTRMYKCSHYSIYCMYAVHAEDLRDNTIMISKRCIDDFKCENGYIVLIDAEEFKKRLPTVKTDGHGLRGGQVIYRMLTFPDVERFLTTTDTDNLFIKHPYFSYQHEYRIVVEENLKDYNKTRYEQKEYWFPQTLDSISKTIPVSSLIKKEDLYLLKV